VTDLSSARDAVARDPAGEYARQDAILDRLDADKALPGWVWTAMTDTVARLRELPDDLAWVATRYLQTVQVRGQAMFGDPINYQQTVWNDDRPPETLLRCPCGRTAPADPPRRYAQRDIGIGRCPAGHDVAVFDGIPYDGPTLISASLR
jgi:hypothetical protein